MIHNTCLVCEEYSLLGCGGCGIFAGGRAIFKIIIDFACMDEYLTCMRKARQINFSSVDKKFKFLRNTAFGGEKFHSFNPMTARPLASNTPIHLVMRSDMAKGNLSLKHHDDKIREILWTRARALGIQIKDFANVGNHLHLVIILPKLRVWKEFIRSVAGLIARAVLKVERGAAKGIKFWTGRPWTRLVNWGRDFQRIKRYLGINQIQALGFTRKTAIILDKMGLEGVTLKC